jgi:hypothetical protein
VVRDAGALGGGLQQEDVVAVGVQREVGVVCERGVPRRQDQQRVRGEQRTVGQGPAGVGRGAERPPAEVHRVASRVASVSSTQSGSSPAASEIPWRFALTASLIQAGLGSAHGVHEGPVSPGTCSIPVSAGTVGQRGGEIASERVVQPSTESSSSAGVLIGPIAHRAAPASL